MPTAKELEMSLNERCTSHRPQQAISDNRITLPSLAERNVRPANGKFISVAVKFS
jgi:hypothetical protein